MCNRTVYELTSYCDIETFTLREPLLYVQHWHKERSVITARILNCRITDLPLFL
jgi:hypothetical protein